jgi:hypothetical protein
LYLNKFKRIILYYLQIIYVFNAKYLYAFKINGGMKMKINGFGPNLVRFFKATAVSFVTCRGVSSDVSSVELRDVKPECPLLDRWKGYTHFEQKDGCIVPKGQFVDLIKLDSNSEPSLCSGIFEKEIIEDFLAAYRNNDKDRLFLLSTCVGNLKFVNEWVKLGVNVNYQNKEGVSALMLAVDNCDANLTKRLLEVNADVNAQTINGTSSLMFAARNCTNDTVFNLIKAGANRRHIDNNGKSVFEYARVNKHQDVMAFLQRYE